MGDPFQSVHRAERQPSYSYYPNQSVDQAPPFMYAKQQQGPPPALANKCPHGMRYSQTDGWYCATAPCYGEKPHDRARCNLQTGEWVVPTVGGFIPTHSESLVQMGPCAINPQSYPAVSKRNGRPVCDQLTGTYYYEGEQGIPGLDDRQSLGAYSTFERDKSSSAETRKTRGGLTTWPTSYLGSGVLLDRAYTGGKPKVRFYDSSTQRLHPALTNMGTYKTRGHYQKNSQISPTLRVLAQPTLQPPRGGYMKSQRLVGIPSTPFTEQDVERGAQVFLKPAVITSEVHRAHRWGNA